jgi:hypothetical protein
MTIYTEFKCKCKINKNYIKCIKEFNNKHEWNYEEEFIIKWKEYLKKHYLAIIHNYDNTILQTYWPLKHDNIDLNKYYLEYKNYPPLSELNNGFCIFDDTNNIWEFNGKTVNYQNQVEAFHDIVLNTICDEIIQWDISETIVV